MLWITASWSKRIQTWLFQSRSHHYNSKQAIRLNTHEWPCWMVLMSKDHRHGRHKRMESPLTTCSQACTARGKVCLRRAFWYLPDPGRTSRDLCNGSRLVCHSLVTSYQELQWNFFKGWKICEIVLIFAHLNWSIQTCCVVVIQGYFLLHELQRPIVLAQPCQYSVSDHLYSP